MVSKEAKFLDCFSHLQLHRRHEWDTSTARQLGLGSRFRAVASQPIKLSLWLYVSNRYTEEASGCCEATKGNLSIF
ncbi:hypothetical protein P121_gp03 [Pelagibacter phage HTVC121P]|nr:hypothetical protein P121_gp03 [Pelagibacter phage HTVC121P]